MKSYPIIYRSLISGLINLLTCVLIAVCWQYEGRGIFVLIQLVYPGFLFGYLLSIDTRDTFHAWSFILPVGLISIVASLLYFHTVFSDDASIINLLLASTLPGLLIFFLYRIFINRKFYLVRALLTFLPLSFAISLIPAIALFLKIKTGYENVFSGILCGLSILLWQLGFSFVARFYSHRPSHPGSSTDNYS